VRPHISTQAAARAEAEAAAMIALGAAAVRTRYLLPDLKLHARHLPCRRHFAYQLRQLRRVGGRGGAFRREERGTVGVARHADDVL
jgi:hypothetical protein